MHCSQVDWHSRTRELLKNLETKNDLGSPDWLPLKEYCLDEFAAHTTGNDRAVPAFMGVKVLCELPVQADRPEALKLILESTDSASFPTDGC